MLFGCAPAWQSSRLNLNDVLKQGGQSALGGGRHGIRRTLVVAEFANTIYNDIMNLTTREMYLYYAGDFESAKHFNWTDLMTLTPRSVLMRRLFPDAPIVQMYEIDKAQGPDAALNKRVWLNARISSRDPLPSGSWQAEKNR